MRKDAKIGFAIGAVLLAVLTVYAIVVPKKRTAVTQGVKVVPQGIAGATSPGDTVTVEPNKTVIPSGSDVTPAPAPLAKVDPAPAPGPVADATPPKSPDGVDWEKLIGKQPAMMTTTPETHSTEESAGPSAPGGAVVPTPAEGGTVTHPFAEIPGGVSTPAPTTPAPNRHTSRPHTTELAAAGSSAKYVVEEGDTLSSIASEKYGAAHYYIQIMKANPSINPNRLRPGTKIVMPDLSTAIAASKSPDTAVADLEAPHTSIRVDADGAAGGGVFTPTLAHDTLFAATSTSSDATYTVAAGDSLYRISKKLYGTPRMAHQIFTANADTIGPDMAKLKLGMVLTLPEAPTN